MSAVYNIKLVRLQILRDQIMAPKSAPNVTLEAPVAQRKRVKNAEIAPEPEVVQPTADEAGLAKKKRKVKAQDKPAEGPAAVESPLAPQAAPEGASKPAEAAAADDAETLMDTVGQAGETDAAVVEVPACMKIVAAGTDADSDDDYRRRSSSMPSRPEQCGAWYSLQDLKDWSKRTSCGRVPDKACDLSFCVCQSCPICHFMRYSICANCFLLCAGFFDA